VAESSEEAPSAKRRRTFSEGEKSLLAKHKQHIKLDEEHSAESECTVKPDSTSERTKPERRRVSDEVVTGRKDRKRKRSSIQSVGEQESEITATTAKAAKAGDNSAKKSAVSRKDGDTLHQPDSKYSLPSDAEELNQSVNKKRANKLKKEKKFKNKQKAEPLQLRVISKLVVFLCYVSCGIIDRFVLQLYTYSY